MAFILEWVLWPCVQPEPFGTVAMNIKGRRGRNNPAPILKRFCRSFSKFLHSRGSQPFNTRSTECNDRLVEKRGFLQAKLVTAQVLNPACGCRFPFLCNC